MGLLDLFKRTSPGQTTPLSTAQVDSNWQKIMDLFPTPASGNTDVGKVPALKSDKTGFEFVQLTTGSGGGVIPLVIIGAATDTYQDNALMGKTILLVSTDNAVRIPTDYAFTSGTGTIVFASSIETNSIIQILYK